MTKRKRTKTPTFYSKICCGCRVEVIKGQHKGQFGTADTLRGSLWSVRVDGTTVSMHRRCLKRIDSIELEVAA